MHPGESAAARELQQRMLQSDAPAYLMAALTQRDLLTITTIYNHPISLLLRENQPPSE